MGKAKTKDPLQTFGENLKRLREARNLSLRNLSALCRIDYSDIAKIEKGEKNITLLTLIELAKAFDIHPKKLLDFEYEHED